VRKLLLAATVILCACSGSPARETSHSYCSERTFEGSRFTVCENRGGKLQLLAAASSEPPLRNFADINRKLASERIAFAMNAGMFDEAGRPIGLTIVNGRQIHKLNVRDGPGNFHMKPNGVFLVSNGRPQVVVSEAMSVDGVSTISLATQSGPMLVIGGKLHPKIEPNGSSRLIRNGVGVTNSGRALFVISEEAVSFGKLARFFRDGLKTPNALFFDGSVSSLWDPANGRMDSHSELGPMIVALKPSVSKPGREGPARP
jgi:prepilin-type processing-associated H-X9-DG protein